MSDPRPEMPATLRLTLAKELRHLIVVEKGLRAVDVDRGCEWTEGKTSRILRNTRMMPSIHDVTAILNFLEIVDPERREHLISLARDGRKKTDDWWYPYRKVLGKPYVGYIGAEAAASGMRGWDPQLIYGLLQTEDYAMAIMRASAADLTVEEMKQRVEVRSRRQLLLKGDDPLQVAFILDEGVLARPIGGPKVMAAQLRHLIHMAEMPHVSIRVLPFDLGEHAALTGQFTILEFASTTPTAVYIENAGGDLVLEHPDRVERFSRIWDRLDAAAISQRSSLEVIAAWAERFAAQTA